MFFIGASQSISQFPSSLRKRLLNNVGLHFLGRHYDADMNDFTRYMGISKETIQTLRPYHFIVKVEEYSPLIIRSPKGLLGRSPKMIRDKKKQAVLKKYQLQEYYENLEENSSNETDTNAPLQPLF